MLYSHRIEQAIRAASVLHEGQVRRGRVPFPYITHLFSVACIIADYTDDEDTIVAGLLHDTIEDTDYTLAELEEDFGSEVATIVEEVTAPNPASEKFRTTYSKEAWNEEWQKRHAGYVAQLKNASEAGLIVAAADKIHNIRSMIEEYYGDWDRFQNDFGGSVEERLTIYQNIGNILNSRLENEIVREFNHVFDEYKHFIYDEKD